MSLAQVGSVIENCNRESVVLHRRALFNKWFANVANFIIIIASSTAGIVSIYKGDNLTTIILNFSIAAIKSILIFYTPEKRALMLERISIEVARLARKLRRLDVINPDQELIRRTLDRAYDRLDELKIRKFGGTPEKIVDNQSGDENNISN